MQISGAVADSVKLNSADGAPITDLNPLPTSGGGSAGGSLLADVLLTDNNAALFVARDNGTTISFFNLNTNEVYTPVGTIKAAGLTDAQLRAAPVSVINEAAVESQRDMVLLLTRMLNYLNAPQGYDKSLQRQRGTMVVESGTITQVSTVATVTNQTSIGGVQAQILPNGVNLSAWALNVRTRIT